MTNDENTRMVLLSVLYAVKANGITPQAAADFLLQGAQPAKPDFQEVILSTLGSTHDWVSMLSLLSRCFPPEERGLAADTLRALVASGQVEKMGASVRLVR